MMDPLDDGELAPLPDALREKAAEGWRSLMDIESAESQARFEAHREKIIQAIARSDFLFEQLRRHPDVLEPLFEAELLARPWCPGEIREEWQAQQPHIQEEAELQKALRTFRRRWMFRIVWRDLLGDADLEETMGAMTELADACIDGAVTWLYADACREWGTPMGADPVTGEHVAQPLLVIGMGKLGAGELNLSSDIDLIFAYPSSGETEGARRTVDNQVFFSRLGQRLIRALDQPTADGFVFRVDMRLRPNGESGPLAMSFDALETYYQNQGREWERYALIKARVVSGPREHASHLQRLLHPFIYRRYIDFSAFESLREMKKLIQREVRRRSLESNIKLGAGGIREIEFVAQAFQLIRGGREPVLQERRLREVLSALGSMELLPDEVVADLDSAYVLLRDTEHALQGIADQQTQTLPSDAVGRARVVLIMGYADWDGLASDLQAHRERVNAHFADIIALEEDGGEDDGGHDGWEELWAGSVGQDTATRWLEKAGFESATESLERLRSLREGRAVTTLQTEGRRRLDRFLPRLLAALAEEDAPSATLERVLPLVEAVLRRSAYLLLLTENPGALRELVRLCAASPWIADQLAETPLLLDELLNAESLYTPPDRDQLQADLNQQMLRIPLDDLEEQMEALRHFRKAHVLRVAASEIRGTLPLMKVSDYLTWTAEAVLEHVVVLAWHHLTQRYGTPTDDRGEPIERDFAIIGYGKFGGIELGYTSDLDLVFVHDSDPQNMTDGEKSIDNAVFYARLGQRVVHILQARTPSGQLYEVDMRLRPSGNSGLLVSTLDAFRSYQERDAWTWEHQALVRARWVAGSQASGEGFARIRHDILARERDPEALRQEVVIMRQRMRDAHASRDLEVFHIKQDPGGIIDIEFMVQYLILAWADRYPAITRQSDNIRQMESLGEAGVLDTAMAERLRDVFITMRSTVHRRALQRLNSEVPADQFEAERRYVMECWQTLMHPPTV
ncbi:bifunctional [glutamate--ammonia ligase]-adenylyl-L-tyrosine phosphorylase/[glutamate--ammonia-ligase] adenylyltransferase [Vreelandella utahensis]|uniref:bifunctional [glutamate--ammonia ligase]-adenylyl-L-tyrosine phosphorylase/[glutamate--ammonia-ligase] adenylyltransferase n=1 Tax=Vreelandella halophila TaxID=86177 RepID=UPI001C4DDEB2|nr:bifunctional [glutamate--ammonia ligase]-adenylyl-L-tyrosine phosphorylase/[glutamate--ammonia-ligase] adenylyltransferase [Halomonas utahensis]